MWNNVYVDIIMLAFATVCSSQHMDYTIPTSDSLSYYDYPTPQGIRLQYLQSENQHSHQSHYQNSNEHQYQHQHQQQYPRSLASSAIVNEFDSPDLENAAFTMALTRQGFIIVDGGSTSTSIVPSAALTAKLSKTQKSFTPITVHPHPQPQPQPQPQLQPQPYTHTKMISQPISRSNSQNVKLPLPLGATPIAFAPLPLQSGAPYSTVRGLTSYGTPYAQRRR